MPEQQSTYYSQWTNEKETLSACRPCKINGDTHFGTLMRRRVFERDGDNYTEYKVYCYGCKRSTVPHRSKQIAIKEWEGRNQPGDGLKYRSRTPNIAINREAKAVKGDGSDEHKKSTDEEA